MKGSASGGRRLKGAWAAEAGREMEERLARPRMDDPAPGLRGNEREHATGCRAWRNTTLWRCAAAARRRTEQAAIAMAALLRQWRWGGKEYDERTI